MMVTFI